MVPYLVWVRGHITSSAALKWRAGLIVGTVMNTPANVRGDVLMGRLVMPRAASVVGRSDITRNRNLQSQMVVEGTTRGIEGT